MAERRGDWFRRSTWSSTDRDEFFGRLARSRSSFHKSQYLLIQAEALAHTGEPALQDAALELLDKCIVEFPGEAFLAEAYFLRATIFAARGRVDDAVAAFRDSFAAERARPNMHSGAYLHFAELVVTTSRADLYDEALARLDEFGDEEPFPVQRYWSSVARALIADHRGDVDLARRHAEVALEAAAATKSPFARHRTLGLVDEQRDTVRARLLALVSRDH